MEENKEFVLKPVIIEKNKNIYDLSMIPSNIELSNVVLNFPLEKVETREIKFIDKDLTKYVLCECGQQVFKSNLSGHKKHQRHTTKMEEKNNAKK